MKKLTQRDLTDNYFINQLNRYTVLTSSELNLSAILAGFSLGAVVALLFIDSSILVRGMFILSIISSCLLILSVLTHQGVLNHIQDMLAHLDFFETKKDKYYGLAKIEKDSIIGSIICLLGLFCFLSVLMCACFIYSSFFGIIMLIVFIPMLTLILKKLTSSSIDIGVDIFFGKFEDLPE